MKTREKIKSEIQIAEEARLRKLIVLNKIGTPDLAKEYLQRVLSNTYQEQHPTWADGVHIGKHKQEEIEDVFSILMLLYADREKYLG